MRALVITLLLAGCSIFDKPDPGRLDGGFQPDIGIDMGTDAGGVDAPYDAGSDTGDAFMCGSTTENCGNGLDDDCDGLIDCADPDCIVNQSPACCVAGVPTVTERFDKPATGWTTEANWVAPASIEDAIVPSGQLLDMGASLTGMVNRTCLRVDLGTELRFTFQASPCRGADCDGRMEVVLGPSAMFTGMLTDDLAIRGVVTAPGNLRIDIVQGGTVRSSSTGTYGTAVTNVTVDLAPGLARGVPAIIATVSATSGMDREVLASQIYVTDRDIFGTSACHGLHLGVQGSGDHVALDDVSIKQLDCSNPARFDTVHDDSDTIDAVTMSVADATRMNGWGHGGIGDPALIESMIAGQHTFTLLFDGSPVDRASDVIGHLPLQIGAADTSEHGSGSELIFVDDCSRWQPRGGGIACMPSTSMPIVDSPLVRRDPTLYPNDPADPTTFIAAWVGETSAGSDLALFTGQMAAPTLSHVSGTPTPIGNHETCTSFRNPLLLPRPGISSQYLLFYVCDAFPPVVHAATFNAATATATRIDGLELGPTELGPLAAQGVIDIAGVVYTYAGATTYRLWLATRPSTTDTAVLYVEGVAMGGTLPVFTPFAGNPVLTEQSPVFDTCAFGCQIHGITATRIQNDWTHVRLLVERWVDSGSGLQYGLVPLEQTWPTDHP